MKSFKIHIAILLFLLIGMKGFSQQDPMYTQYMNNPLSVNPAIAGSRDISSLTGVFRKQWVGIEGAPTTSSLSYNSLVKKYDFGLGATLLYDALGPVSQTGLFVDYAYPIRFENGKVLSLGLKGGFSLFDINTNSLRYNDAGDQQISITDESYFLPNFGIGAFYHTEDFYLGFSVPKLIRNTFDKSGTDLSYLDREEMHMFLMSGYIFKLTEDIDFKPSFITRYASGSPLSIDLTATVMLMDKIWLGAMYRFGDSFGGLIRWQVNQKIHIGYSYDMSHNTLKAFNSGSHEIFIGIDFIDKDDFDAIKRFF